MMIAAAVLFTGAFAEARPAFNARFEHADSTVRSVNIGASGRVSINVTMTRSDEPAKSTLLDCKFIKGQKKMMFQSGSDMEKMDESGVLPFAIQFPDSDITTKPEITKDGSSWKLSFGQDSEDKPVELMINVNSNDCKAAIETTTDAAAEEYSSESTTVAPDERRLEAQETTPAPEIPDETEETEEEESLFCDDGLTCDLTLKSCQITKETLPAGSAGKGGDNSSAVQNSSCAILAAMVAYLMI